jgi:hypothetical protein
MAEWVVDGDNVVGSRPDGWWRDRAGAKRRLVERLERFAAARDVPVTVVFDGRAIDAGGGDRVVQPRRPTGRPAILRRSSCFRCRARDHRECIAIKPLRSRVGGWLWLEVSPGDALGSATVRAARPTTGETPAIDA